jgi:alkanesulfonate monooxygenase SsuD/methylene tetrahydromethanopterin reductase-like flavin-dependent oxidoreductase (luciferase family)
LIPVPPVETALRFLEEERAGGGSRTLGILPRARRKIVGGPGTVRRGIEAAAREYGAEEVMVVTITYEHEARRRSYELIAEAFGLSGAVPAEGEGRKEERRPA